MIISEAVLRHAKNAIDKEEKEFKMNSLNLLVVKEVDYKHIVGQMPSYFEYNHEKYVVYSKVNRQ